MIMSHTSLDDFHDTTTAQRADELARAYGEVINVAGDAALTAVLAGNFPSYSHEGVGSRQAAKECSAALCHSFSNRRSLYGNDWAIERGAIADGLTVQTDVMAGKDRVASISIWDGTVTARVHRRLHLRRLHLDRRRRGRPTLGHGGLRRYVPVISLPEPSGLAQPPLQHAQSTR
jgi:hypothetical protein